MKDHKSSKKNDCNNMMFKGQKGGIDERLLNTSSTIQVKTSKLNSTKQHKYGKLFLIFSLQKDCYVDNVANFKVARLK